MSQIAAASVCIEFTAFTRHIWEGSFIAFCGSLDFATGHLIRATRGALTTLLLLSESHLLDDTYIATVQIRVRENDL